MQPADTSVGLVAYQDLLWAVPISAVGTRQMFLLDTGAGLTIVDSAYASRLGIVSSSSFSGRRMSGEVVEIGLAGEFFISIGPVEIAHDTVGVFPIASLLPEEWPQLGGALGLPTFADRPVTIDLGNQRLEFQDPTGLSARAHASAPLSIRPVQDGPVLDLFVEVSAAGHSLWFGIDTGNPGPVVVAPAVAQWLSLDPEEPDVQEVQLELVGSRPAPTQAVVRPIIYDGVLGLGFLSGRALTLDLSTGRAWLD